MLTTMLGLIAFAAGIERYLIRRATWLETMIFLASAACLLWPHHWIDVAGAALFATAVAMQKLISIEQK